MGQQAKQRRSKTAGDRTLEELDGERWGEPTYDSYVVRTCHALRRKPINSLTDEELRLAIGQGIGLDWLVPLALQRLVEDPFRAGDFFEGDLLVSLSDVPVSYWARHPVEKKVLVAEIIKTAAADDRFSDMTMRTQQALTKLRALSE